MAREKKIKLAPPKRYKLIVQMSNVDGICTKTIYYPRNRFNDYEWINSIDEVKDNVMALEIGERMYFKSLRDEPHSLGIITRIE